MQVVRSEAEFKVGGRGGEEQTGSFCPYPLHNFNALIRIRKENIINVDWYYVEFA